MDDSSDHGAGSGVVGGSPMGSKSPFSPVLKLLAVLGIIVLAICLVLPAQRTAREAARRNQCANNLKRIALALLNYADAYEALPPAYTTDANGKPLHSWRTLILPYLDEQALYKSIDLTKPWDDPANSEVFKTQLEVYQCPSTSDIDNRTTYQAVLTPHSCFRPTEPRPLSEVADLASPTMMVIEVDSNHAVPWMSPEDADENLVMGIERGSKLDHVGTVHAAFVDGTVGLIDVDSTAAQRRALISVAGNDKADADGDE